MPLSTLLPSPAGLLKGVAATLAVAVVAGGGALYLCQSKLIYPAGLPSGSRTNVPRPDEFGISPYEELTLTTPDGVRIKAFLMLYERDGVEASTRPTVLLLHANAGNVGHRLPIAKVFWSKMRCNVLALSYRGYGHSEGSPSEHGLKLDAQTALDTILSHPKLEKTPIFLYGQSIGGAVAIHLASENAQRVKGLVIENTFMSLRHLVPHLMPYLAPFVPYLLHQIWPSIDDIATLPEDFPVLFLAGVRDELVEPGQMKGLWAACRSKRKEWKEFPHGTHNDTCVQPHYFHHIARFIASVCDLPLPPSFPADLFPPTSSAATRAPSPTSTLPAESEEKEHLAEKDHGVKEDEDEPVSPSKSEAGSSISSGSASSFELVDRDVEEESGTEGEKLEEKEEISAGSMGPREEAEEVKREAKEKKDEWVKSEL
ncbi:hypothetical protein JCM8097_003515 [Rhodosporidiobolus ruineniae]